MDATKSQETEKKKKSPLKKILDIAYYVVLSLIILLALFYVFMTFSTKNGVTSMFGYVISSVQSGSMSGTFEPGDMIIIKEIEDVNTIQKEDVITFYYTEPQTQQRIIVTHRVIDFEDGKIITQGDVARKNHSVDQIEKIAYGDVIGEYTDVRIPGVGKVTDFIKSKVGFFCCILVPVFLFLFWQIYVFIQTLSEARTLGKKKAINDEARALAEQMLKEMQAQQANATDPPAEGAGSAETAETADVTAEAAEKAAQDSSSQETDQ